MKCNCSDWDDESPCEIHTPQKMIQPEEVCHQIIVVRVYRRRENLKWYYTITRDALVIFISREFDTKKEATPI